MQWFTADLHFGHERIIEYTGRPFKTVKEMDEILIKNWNERVRPDDFIFIIGDFCFRNTKDEKFGENRAKYYYDQLNGHKVFIQGNHDNTNSLNTIITDIIIHYDGKDWHLAHKPEDCQLKYNLCGHIHQKWKSQRTKKGKIIINVGVDVWNYHPVNIQEILEEVKKWKKK